MLRQKTVEAIALTLFLVSLMGCFDLPTDVDDRERLSASQVYSAVKAATGFEIAPWDNVYWCYSKDELKCCLEGASWIKDWPYIQERRDCEDFAFATRDYVLLFNLPGAAFGVIKFSYVQLGELKTHAANIFVDNALKVWIVDWKLHPGIFWEYSDSWTTLKVIL